jgi:hypothetical protein
VAAVADTVLVPVSLEAGCYWPGCSGLAWRFYRKLSPPHYSRGVSVLELSEYFPHWRAVHRTARKRAAHAERLGYRFAAISRSDHPDDILEINRSLPVRQGRPMDAAYLERRDYEPLLRQPCERHRVHEYGVLEGDRLRAYLVFYRVGMLGLISQILGHGDHLAGDVMYLLAAGLVRVQAPLGGVLYYNSHRSGTDGLRFYKERLGFRPVDIEWVL